MASVAGLAGVSPAMALSSSPQSVAWSKQFKKIRSLYRKESSACGEAARAMRGNHPGSLSYFSSA